jgi:hypothetical protein
VTPFILEDLFYGEAVYLMLLLYIILMLGLQFKWKESGALTVPLCVIIGMQYMSEDLGYPALIMFALSIMIILFMANQMRNN